MLPELSGETWVASALLDELTWDLPPAGVNNELVSATSEDRMLQTVRSWVESGNVPPWPACAGLAPELRCWRLQVGNLKIDSLGRLWRRRSPPSVGSQLVVPVQKRQDLIKQFHDSLFAGHLGITQTVFRLLDRDGYAGTCFADSWIAKRTIGYDKTCVRCENRMTQRSQAKVCSGGTG